MKKYLLILAVLILPLGFFGCDSGGDGGGGGSNERYRVEWAAFYSNYITTKTILTGLGVSYTEVTSPAGFWTYGADANTILNYCRSVPASSFFDSGTAIGTFEELLNRTEDGVSLPNNLKQALRANKEKMPIAAAFDAGTHGVIFYVNKY